MKRQASYLHNPQINLNSKVELVVNIFEGSDFTVMIAKDVIDTGVKYHRIFILRALFNKN